MSYTEAATPSCERCDSSVILRIEPKDRDIGDFAVRRILPAPECRAIGPFVFFDHFGPIEFPPGKGIQVRPHPHIGLATISYLFEGEIIHRDSLGFTQAIREGAVNLMTAGSGIVHSERAGDDLYETSTLHGLQTWIALPGDQAEMAPDFAHYPAKDLPEFEHEGAKVRIIMGSAYGKTSPVRCYSPTLYAELRIPAGGRVTLPGGVDEQALYVISGEVRIDDESYGGNVLAVAREGAKPDLEAVADSLVMIIGGQSLGKRTVWWNFVAESRDRIEKAKSDWREGRFGKIEGDDEFIPLPD